MYKKSGALMIAAIMLFNIFVFPNCVAFGAVFVAKPATASVYVDGVKKDFTAFNISGSNYFKLRDIAYAINGTEKKFEVEWDKEKNAINLTSSRAYTPVGGELAVNSVVGDRTALPSQAAVHVNGTAAHFKAYNIDGSTYFKLRDIMETVNIGVGWDEKNNAISLETDKNYEGEDKNGANTKQADTALSTQEIYENCSPAVFFLPIINGQGDLTATGSGFFLTSDGLAVTNYHVLEGAYSGLAVLSDGAEYEIQSVIDYDAKKDLALIKIAGSGFPYLEAGDSTVLKGGDKIYTIGSPLGFDNTISEGIVSNPNRIIDDIRMIQVSAPISHGSSGGVLLNAAGKAVGVTAAGVDEGQNLNFAIPIEETASLDRTKTPVSLKDVFGGGGSDTNASDNTGGVIYEIEDNGSFETADYIYSGENYAGLFDYNKGFDVVCFDSFSGGTILVALVTDAEYDDIDVYLYNSYGEAVAKAERVKGSDGLDSLGLYYISGSPDYYFVSVQDHSGKHGGNLYILGYSEMEY